VGKQLAAIGRQLIGIEQESGIDPPLLLRRIDMHQLVPTPG
jgi:hypothetical protein